MLQFNCVSVKKFREQFYPKGANREQLRPPVAITLPDKAISNQRYEARLVNTGIGQPFNFQITRKSSNVVM